VKNRLLRLALALVAAAMHVAAPVAAYARPGWDWDASPKDFCSTSRVAAVTPAGSGFPSPASNEHHCAHAPCCPGGVVGGAAPPPVLALLHVVSAGASTPATTTVAAPVAPIVAAQPRGPPHHT
jgi:hypothetical protein